MDLDEWNSKSLDKDMHKSKDLSDLVNNFISELKEYFQKDNELCINQYSNYWKYQNFIEDNVAARLGLSKWATNNTYNAELSKAVDDNLLKISKEEGTIYRKQFLANGFVQGQFYNIDKFENGKMTKITIPQEKVPKDFQDKDIIFQYSKRGTIRIRNDLKEKVINMTIDKTRELKQKENEKAEKYKKEGHIYEAIEDDGYIFLKDTSKDINYSIEDIDFVVNNYKGDGKYQVINGEYKKNR